MRYDYKTLGSSLKRFTGEVNMPAEIRDFVVGFMFNDLMSEVVMIEKNPRRPEMMWQKGLLNGVGGKVEPNETPLMAMIREYQEEAGVVHALWTEVTVLNFQENNHTYSIRVFAAKHSRMFERSYTTSHEKIWKIPVSELGPHNPGGAVNDIHGNVIITRMIDNVPWLIPLCVTKLSNPAYPTYICNALTPNNKETV